MILGKNDSDRHFELQQIKDIGAQYIRVDLPYYSDGSTVDFDRVANDAIDNYGLEVMPILFGTTGPVSASTAQAFAQAQAARWAGKIWMFELMNEPNTNGWTGTQYGQAVMAAYKGLKAGNPNAVLIVGALGNNGTTDMVKFVQDMYATFGGKRYMDYFSMHLYDDPDLVGPGSERNEWYWGFYSNPCVRSIMDANGDADIPIISTETGLCSSDNGVVTDYYNESNQAAVTGKDFDHLTNYPILPSFAVYTMIDWDHPEWGLLRADNTQKPAWAVYQERAK
jgi:hypothetical protein